MIFKKNYQLYTGCSQSFCFKTTTKVIFYIRKVLYLLAFISIINKQIL